MFRQQMINSLFVFIFHENWIWRIYPTELQLNEAMFSDTEAPFWIWIYVYLMVQFPPKFMINGTIDFDFDIVNFPFLDGDVIWGIHISTY